MDYFKQFEKHIQNHDYSSFLTLWEEYCLGDEIDPKELKKTLETVRDSSLASPFGRHVENALPLWEQIKDEKYAHEIFKLIVDVQTTNTPELGDLVFTYLKKVYGETPHFHEKIRLTGLRERLNFKGAVRNFELLNHLAGGNFVFHTGGWGVGEIMDVSFLREQISLEFDYVPGRKDLSFQNGFNTLSPLSKEHFLSRRFGNPDELEKLARKDPVKVLRMVLHDIGPLTAADLKQELCGLVIPEEDWGKWWQSARNKLKKDTFIQLPDSLQAPFVLREEEVPHEETLSHFLDKKPTADMLIQTVYSFLRDFPNTLKNEAFKKSLQMHITAALSTHELTDAQELQIHYFLQDISPELELTSVHELLKRLSSIETLIHDVNIIAFKKRILVDIRAIRDDWTTIFLSLFTTIEQNPIRDYVLEELLSNGKEKEVEAKLEQVLSSPEKYPQLLLWYFEKIMDKASHLPFSSQEGKERFFEALFILLSRIEQSAEQREHVKKIHTFITNARFANVRKIYQNAKKEIVQEFLLLASKCHSLSEHDVSILYSLAEVVHPSLKMQRKRPGEAASEDTTIWTTQQGFDKVQERIRQIATVETVENAREIEEARSHGDLRENAEFKSALERRDRLQAELKLLSDQLSQARVLSPADIATDEVGVGTIVECTANGETVTFTLLGPWDANPEENILAFQSKLAQSLTGKKIGDTVAVQGKEYTITKIASYFN